MAIKAQVLVALACILTVIVTVCGTPVPRASTDVLVPNFSNGSKMDNPELDLQGSADDLVTVHGDAGHAAVHKAHGHNSDFHDGLIIPKNEVADDTRAVGKPPSCFREPTASDCTFIKGRDDSGEDVATVVANDSHDNTEVGRLAGRNAPADEDGEMVSGDAGKEGRRINRPTHHHRDVTSTQADSLDDMTENELSIVNEAHEDRRITRPHRHPKKDTGASAVKNDAGDAPPPAVAAVNFPTINGDCVAHPATASAGDADSVGVQPRPSFNSESYLNPDSIGFVPLEQPPSPT